MTTKYISRETTVDLNESRCVWDNGAHGDARVSLWADAGNVHVWAETNGDPVYGEDELVELLTAEGLDDETCRQIVEGDLSGVEQ